MARSGKLSSGRITISPNIGRTKRAPRKAMPWIFGRGGRDRALICLAVNGPMTVRELGRSIGSDSHKTWNMVEVLKTSGLVVKRDRSGGRKYVALNRKLPVYEQLMAFLLAMDKTFPTKRVPQPSYRWGMWQDDGHISPARLDEMFQGAMRSRILLSVAAADVTDMTTIARLLGLNEGTVLYVVDHWERQSVIKTDNVHRHRLVRLNDKFLAADELRALLISLIENDPTQEHVALGACAKSRMRPVIEQMRSERHVRRCASKWREEI